MKRFDRRNHLATGVLPWQQQEIRKRQVGRHATFNKNLCPRYMEVGSKAREYPPIDFYPRTLGYPWVILMGNHTHELPHVIRPIQGWQRRRHYAAALRRYSDCNHGHCSHNQGLAMAPIRIRPRDKAHNVWG